MQERSRPWILAATIPVAVALAVGCGSSNDFSSPDGGGGTSGSAGASGSGGTAGSAGAAGSGGTSGSSGTSGSGGASGSAGAAGSGGAAGDGGSVEAGANCATTAECNDAEYCGADHLCHACGDLSSFHFDDPEPLDQINSAHPDDYLRFPRALGEKTAILYSVENAIGSTRAIWATSDFTTGAGAALRSAGRSSRGRRGQSARRFPMPAAGALAGMNFFFDRGIASSFNHEVVGGVMDASGAVASLKALPEPVNIAGGRQQLQPRVRAEDAARVVDRDAQRRVQLRRLDRPASRPSAAATPRPGQPDDRSGELSAVRLRRDALGHAATAR